MTKATEEISGRGKTLILLPHRPPSSFSCSNFWRIVLIETNRSFSGLEVRPKHSKTLGQICVSPLPSLQQVYIPTLSVELVLHWSLLNKEKLLGAH